MAAAAPRSYSRTCRITLCARHALRAPVRFCVLRHNPRLFSPRAQTCAGALNAGGSRKSARSLRHAGTLTRRCAIAQVFSALTQRVSRHQNNVGLQQPKNSSRACAWHHNLQQRNKWMRAYQRHISHNLRGNKWMTRCRLRWLQTRHSTLAARIACTPLRTLTCRVYVQVGVRLYHFTLPLLRIARINNGGYGVLSAFRAALWQRRGAHARIDLHLPRTAYMRITKWLRATRCFARTRASGITCLAGRRWRCGLLSRGAPREISSRRILPTPRCTRCLWPPGAHLTVER